MSLLKNLSVCSSEYRSHAQWTVWYSSKLWSSSLNTSEVIENTQSDVLDSYLYARKHQLMPWHYTYGWAEHCVKYVHARKRRFVHVRSLCTFTDNCLMYVHTRKYHLIHNWCPSPWVCLLRLGPIPPEMKLLKRVQKFAVTIYSKN